MCYFSFYSKPTPLGYWVDGVQEEWADTVSFLFTANCNFCGLSCVIEHSTTCYSPSCPCLAQLEWLLEVSPVEVWMLRINLY